MISYTKKTFILVLMISFCIMLTNCTASKVVYQSNDFLLSQKEIFKPQKIETLEDMNLNYFNLYKAYLNNIHILESLKREYK